MGNPAMFPLIYNCVSRDIVVIRINPLYRRELPRTAREINNRVNEISFNSSLMREMRAISFVTGLIDDGHITGKALNRMLMHSISADAEVMGLGCGQQAQRGQTIPETLARRRASTYGTVACCKFRPSRLYRRSNSKRNFCNPATKLVPVGFSLVSAHPLSRASSRLPRGPSGKQ